MDRNAILRNILKNKNITILSDAMLPDKIRALRQRKGLSRQEFARAAGVHKCSMWEWESGHKTPSETSLKKICNAFDVDISYFQVMDV